MSEPFLTVRDEDGARALAMDLLHRLVSSGASDLHLRAGAPPALRVDGLLRPLDLPPLGVDEARAVVRSLLPAPIRDRLAAGEDVDLAVEPIEGERFRVNAFHYRDRVGAVLRRVLPSPLSVSQLGLPDVLTSIATRRTGLTIIAGPTGSGKTTTLAALAAAFDATVEGHILTLEDPIEILLPPHRSLITQRELGGDITSFSAGLRSAMRQDPDMIVVGEMRDVATARAALAAAETGHHVLTSVHSTDTVSTVLRIVDLFPDTEQKQVRLSLASVLNAIVSQRLVPRADVAGRLAATEVAVGTGLVREAIIDPLRTDGLRLLVAEGAYHRMHTLNQDLVRLLAAGEIAWSDAVHAAVDAHELEVQVRRAGLLHLTMAG